MELVVEADGVEPDWEDALRRARVVGRRLPGAFDKRGRRRVLVLVAAALACLFAMSAVAAQNSGRVPYWLMGPNPDERAVGGTQPTTVGVWTRAPRVLPDPRSGSRRVPTIHGRTGATGWVFQAFILSPDEIGTRERVLSLGIGPVSRRPANEGAFEAYFRPGWMMRNETDDHLVVFATAIPGKVGDGPKYLYGAAAPDVRQVDLESTDAPTVSVRTFAGPEGLGVPARFWVAVLPLGHLVHTLVPRDADGDALEHWRLEHAQ